MILKIVNPLEGYGIITRKRTSESCMKEIYYSGTKRKAFGHYPRDREKS
jgi:hypothetical protein